MEIKETKNPKDALYPLGAWFSVYEIFDAIRSFCQTHYNNSILFELFPKPNILFIDLAILFVATGISVVLGSYNAEILKHPFKNHEDKLSRDEKIEKMFQKYQFTFFVRKWIYRLTPTNWIKFIIFYIKFKTKKFDFDHFVIPEYWGEEFKNNHCLKFEKFITRFHFFDKNNQYKCYQFFYGKDYCLYLSEPKYGIGKDKDEFREPQETPNRTYWWLFICSLGALLWLIKGKFYSSKTS